MLDGRRHVWPCGQIGGKVEGKAFRPRLRVGGWGRWDCRGITGINKRLDPLIPPGAVDHFCRILFSKLITKSFIRVMKQDDDRGKF